MESKDAREGLDPDRSDVSPLQSGKLAPKNAVLVEISQETLDDLVSQEVLQVGDNVRVIRTLEIHPGAIIAKQYDR